MPLPIGAHYVNSRRKKDGVRLADGRTVTRQEAENLGAQWMGYRNEKDYRSNRRDADRYVNRAMQSKQGILDLFRARKEAKRQGKRFSLNDYKKMIVGIRNTPKDDRGAPVDKSPSSPIAEYHRATGHALKDDWVNY